MIDSKKEAELIASFAFEKKGEDILIVDMSRVSGICDYFVIATASSPVRARTIAEFAELEMKKLGVRTLHREGAREGRWILIDYGDVILHVFGAESRRYYNLEELWGDAPRRSYQPKSA